MFDKQLLQNQTVIFMIWKNHIILDPLWNEIYLKFVSFDVVNMGGASIWTRNRFLFFFHHLFLSSSSLLPWRESRVVGTGEAYEDREILSL